MQKELSEQANPSWPLAKAAPKLETKPVDEAWPPQRTDRTVFIFITAGFYLSILLFALFWWRFRALRRHEHSKVLPDPLVPDATLERAEERWAKHVLGIQTPADAEKTRFSNAPVEQNFLMQLRAI